MPSRFSYKLAGFNELKRILDPKEFKNRLKKHVKDATLKNAQIGASKIVKSIHEGKFEPNSEITPILKGSSRALVDTGTLASSIIGEAPSWNTGMIIANRNSDEQGKKVNLAAILYYGVKIKVTNKMRRLFFWLSKKDNRIKPLSPKTRYIKIPGRKYMDVSVSIDMIDIYKKNWDEAVRKALRGTVV